MFAAHLSKSRLKDMLCELGEIINPNEDDIRVYPLPASGEVMLLGQQFFATNALLVQNGQCRLELLEDVDD